MATWNEVLSEITALQLPNGMFDFDSVRRKYLAELAAVTGRPAVVYATAFLDANPQKARSNVSLHIGDKEGFYAVTSNLPKGPLDVILHSPGGTAEATEAIVSMLRARFDHIRFIVPLAAKSAATMLALSGDEIVGDTTTELGPIDPQFRLLRADVVVNAPAFAILEQWAKAGAEIAKDKTTLTQWIPILNQYGPSLLVECEQQIKLSVELVAKWLTDYMLKGEPDAKKTATALAEYLGDWRNFGSHSRAVSISDIAARGAKGAVMLEEGSAFAEAVWSAWHAISITLANTGIVKLFENSIGDTYASTLQIAVGQGLASTPARNRKERRDAMRPNLGGGRRKR